MADMIYGQRFVGFKEGGWHGKGRVELEQFTAARGYDLMGRYDVFTVPLIIPGYEQVPTKSKAILRGATVDDPRIIHFATVGIDYELITPEKFVELVDTHINRSINTIMALKEGRIMVCSIALPQINVKGDRVDTYLVVSNGMDGVRGFHVMITAIRPVCWNTLKAGELAAEEAFVIRHHEGADKKAGLWMSHLVGKYERQASVLEEAFNILGVYQPKTADVNNVLEYVYPIPKAPRSNMPDSEREKRVYLWEKARDRANESRVSALEKFEGKGIGLDDPALKGSGWYLYNAISEVATHEINRSDEAIPFNLLFGSRGQVIDRAFDRTFEYATEGRTGSKLSNQRLLTIDEFFGN